LEFFAYELLRRCATTPVGIELHRRFPKLITA
jgi:hypothetical protein